MAVSLESFRAPLAWVRGQQAPPPDTPSSSPFLVSTVADLYSIPRRRPASLLWQHADHQRAHILAQFDSSQADRFTHTFKDSAIIFLPGLLNFFPGDVFFKRLSSVFEYGGLVVSVSAKQGPTKHHGLYSVVGSNQRVLQPDWRTEMVVVVKRLIQALNDPQIAASRATKLKIVGHSKGGLLAHALHALALFGSHSQTNANLRQVKNLFPGLEDIALSDFSRLLERLQKAQFFLYGTPVEGIERNGVVGNGVVSAVDQFLLRGSAKHFTPEFISQFFNDLNHPLDQAEAVIHARKHPNLGDVMSADTRLPSFLDNLVTRAARLLFHGGAHLVGGTNSDGLVNEPSSALPNLRVLDDADHLQMVELVEAALALLHILDDHSTRSDSQLSRYHQEIVAAAQGIVRGSPIEPHIGWILEHNPAKALEISGLNTRPPPLIYSANDTAFAANDDPHIIEQGLFLATNLANSRGLALPINPLMRGPMLMGMR